MAEQESTVPSAAPGDAPAGPAPDGPAEWERWTKKRVFVRALEGTYGQLKNELFSQPRVYHTKDWKWKGGPQNYGKKIINPQVGQGRAVDRVPHRCLCARGLRPEARAHEQRRVLCPERQGT